MTEPTLDDAWAEFKAADSSADTSDVAPTATSDSPDDSAVHTDQDKTEESADISENAASESENADESSTSQQKDDEEAEGDDNATEVKASDESADTDESSTGDYDSHDLLDDLPTAEALLAKHQRIPQATKDELVNLLGVARKERDLLNTIGGEQGIEAIKPVMQMLSKAEPELAEKEAAYAALFGANPQATTALVSEAASFFLSEDANPAVRAVGDHILREALGESASVEKFKSFLRLEEAGIIDIENDLRLLENEGEGSTVYQKQQAAIAELRQQLAAKDELIRNPDKLLKKEIDANAEFDADFKAKFDEAIVPFAERGRWGKESPLTELAKRAILSDLQSEPEYKELQKFVSQLGYNREKLPFAVSTSLHTLMNKAKARFDKAIRDVNGQFKERADSSLNAQVKAKVEKRTTPKSEPVKDKDTFGGGLVNTDPDLDALFKEFKNAASSVNA